MNSRSASGSGDVPSGLGIVADDFTGALLVAGSLESAGIPAPVFFDPASIEGDAGADGRIVILATRTRLAPVDEALSTLASAVDALEKAGCRRIAYKACASFDSTEQGNIGPAADFLADRAGDLPVLMSAGFPRYGATVHQGYLFYRGRLVSESIKRDDPLTPMSDPDLVRFLSHQTRSPVVLLPHAVLLRGLDAARSEFARLRKAGARHVLADASDDRDVEITARVALESVVVVVASDPLILELARGSAAAPGGREAVWPDLPEGPGAVLVGSVGPTATTQIARFEARYPVLTLDLLAEESEDALVERALNWLQSRVGRHPVAVTTATGQASVISAQSKLGSTGAARKAERLLGCIAVGLRDMGVRRLVVSGGETSGAVVSALGLTRVRALPEGRLGSGFCVADSPVPMSFFLKSGKLGSDDVLVEALDELGAGSQRV